MQLNANPIGKFKHRNLTKYFDWLCNLRFNFNLSTQITYTYIIKNPIYIS